jgi:hypothetical protein
MGVSPIKARVGSFVAWVAPVEETKRMKPTDKAILGTVSESPGRNASEPTGGLDKKIDPEAESSAYGRRRHGMTWADRDVMTLRRGGRDSTVTRACRATGETVLAPARNRWSRLSRITGNNGKSADGETVAVRLVVAKKWGNTHGAKEPCCTASLGQQGRQG